MKLLFKIYVLLFIHFSYASALFAGDVLDISWKEKVFMKQMGSCETNNLSFSALRFTKIPLNRAGVENLFLRIIVFIRPDKTEAIRLTTQELLGCQNDSEGNEICSYRPHENFWVESGWKITSKFELDLTEAGLLTPAGNEDYELMLPLNFKYQDVAGSIVKGKMIATNFDDHGVNTARLCHGSN